MNYSETYTKASEMMKQALECYANGNFQEGDAIRKKADKLYDLAEKDYEVQIGNAMMLYGENRNFGIIFNVFEENINNDTLTTKNGRKLLKEFVNEIKTNKTLNKQYQAYRTFSESSLCNNVNADYVETYVNEMLSLTEQFDKNELSLLNDKLIKILKENNANELIDIDEDILSLYEAIEYLLTNKKSKNNIVEYVNAKQIIKEHILKKANDKVNIKKSITIDDYVKTMNETVEKYSLELNDDEIMLIKEFTETDNKEKLFEEYKKQTIECINKVINEDKDNDWSEILDLINEKIYNEETVIEDIIKMIEIKNTL